MRFGILVLPKGRKRNALESWFQEGVQRFDCLAWDLETGMEWVELLAGLRARGKSMPIKDSLIAATALAHGLAIVTRDRADFINVGVRIVNPFHD